ncbi:unnamed protein product [Durusdinium trenchii]|uniref:tRNA(Phe) 7-[(3-amino-3-carboxypropyl)-4-demethylwyosine(37)-N(4)]-methyltransferase n=1 Tax=Durusdinium trenchii TaxID=1381693 RepID=A0ABP0MUT3_9DINO
MATETAEFLQRKRQILASLDRSPKGSLDAPIVDFLSWLNEQEGVVTTSSCSGRIAIFHGSADLNNSKGGQWLLASHALVDVPETWAQLQQSLEGQSDATGTLTTLLLEPFVLHAECVDATLGQTMLSAAREAGFRESGLSLGRKRVMVQIRTLALRLEVPLASDGRLLVDGNYFQTLLEIANRRLEENFARTQRLWAQLREALQRTEATPAEPWVLICASSLARGVKLALEARAWMDTDRKMQKLEGAESKIGVPLTMEAAEHFQALAASRAEASDQMAREPADVDQEKQKAEALPSPAAPRPPKSQRPPTSAADLEALWQTGALSLTRAELPGKAKPASHTDASHGKGVNLEEVILNLLKPLPLEKQQSLVSEKMLAEARSVVVQWRGDVALLPRGGALGSEWDALADLKALPAGLWESMRDALGARLLARQQEIRVDDEVRGGNVQVLAGSGSPWVVVPGPRGVRYSFDITKCMFSEGNAAEKERVAAWPVQGETILDMYAGIGFWTLPLLAAGAEHVFACEWNPHALEGLREGLRLLGAPGSCEVLAGDNRRDEVKTLVAGKCHRDIHMGDESYRGPPVRGFDDSQGPGITSFKAKTNLGPTDFGFLLGPLTWYGGVTRDTWRSLHGFFDFFGITGQVQEASSVPVPPSPLSDGSDAGAAWAGGYGDSSGMLKRCRSRGDQEMLVDAKRLAVEGLQPPIVALRPQQVLSGFVEGEDRGSNLQRGDKMDPPVVRTDPFSWLRDDTHQNDTTLEGAMWPSVVAFRSGWQNLHEEIQQLLEDEDTYCALEDEHKDGTRALSGLQELSDTLLREMRSAEPQVLWGVENWAEMVGARGHEKDSSVGIPSIYPGGYAYYSRGTKKRSYQSHFRARVVADATDSATRGQPVPADVAVLAEVINLKLADEEWELLLDENDLNDDGEGGSRPYLPLDSANLLHRSRSVCGPDPSADHLFYAYAKDFEGNDSYQISPLGAH